MATFRLYTASDGQSRVELKLVQLLSAGYDRVDVEAAKKAGVPASNNGGANAIAVADTCRGPVVDETALAATLSGRRILGAGLDVMIDEPPAPDHPLFALPNVTITPHSAGPTWENWIARFRNGFDDIQRGAAGRAPLWVIPDLA